MRAAGKHIAAGWRRFGRGLKWLGLLLAAAPLPARAGAWIAPPGGQTIQTEVAGQRENGAPFLESQYYLEAPVTPGMALVVKPWAETALAAREVTTRGELELGVKGVLARTAHTVTALQASALWRSDPPAGCGEGGGEIRALSGVSSGRAFLNAEIAARLNEGGCAANRLDFAAGYRPDRRWLALGETFTDLPQQGETTTKAQLSLVRFGAHGGGFQIGLRARVDGGGDEAALIVALWGRPRR